MFESPISHIRNESQNVSMRCTIEAKPPPDAMRWLKNGRELRYDAERMKTTATAAGTNYTWSLTIVNLRGDDGGMYACEATNYISGATSMSATLDVYCELR